MLTRQTVPEAEATVAAAHLKDGGKKVARDKIGLSEEDENFKKILAAEHEAIEARRKCLGRKRKSIKEFGTASKSGKNRPVYDTTGVALSGGGIRSAAFCLGALQALEAKELIAGVDYLSTVSGGGYIGASMTGCMAQPTGRPQQFPFGAPGEYEDRDAVGHLRDYSNYLLPRGGNSFLDVITVLLRGWATNAIFVLGIVLTLALPILVAFPDSDTLDDHNFAVWLAAAFFSLFRIDIVRALSWVGTIASAVGIGGQFALTIAISWTLAIVLAGWAIARSFFPDSDVTGRTIRVVHVVLVLLITALVIEAQPAVIRGFFLLRETLANSSLSQIVKAVGVALAPFSAVVVFFRDQLGAFLKNSQSRPGVMVFVQRVAAQLAMWTAALVLPLVVYAFFVWVCATGISVNGEYLLAPGLISSDGRIGPLPVAWAYFLASCVLIGLIALFTPNGNSLHRLYRDKLSKAFLFDPVRPAGADSRADLRQRDTLQLSAISPKTGGPYHLINAAINLQNSKYANRRGRNATFFLFSSKFVGSDVTGYVATDEIERDDPRIDLGTAMAISGAAVSANMGSYTISALAPTLALLNIRLGYWLVNPRAVEVSEPDKLFIPNASKMIDGGKISKRRRLLSRLSKYYLIDEIIGNLDETSPHIYVTDGGHIENLGFYQLLRRGCRAIIVVDAEADPDLTFGALAKVERYARIDLGIRIDLPWEQIAKSPPQPASPPGKDGTVAWPAGVPHCALGLVHYPNGEKGLLLYVKASVTGDEADYVLDYKSRNPAFPHESTGDQFFSEEQFEVYRALGFHAVQSFFDEEVGFLWRQQSRWDSFRKPDPLAPEKSPPPSAKALRDCFEELFN